MATVQDKPSQLWALLAPVVTGLGYEWVGLELSGGGRHALLRIYIDHPPGGVTVEDCERVSRQISAVLDVEDPIRGQYTLEVSSPGLDRPLFTAAHFERYAGEQVKLQLQVPLDGHRKLAGRLVGLEGESVVVQGEDEQSWRIPLHQIAKARLVPNLGQAKGGNRK